MSAAPLKASTSVDVWLRGEIHATTHELTLESGDAKAWSDRDVAALLTAMLRVMRRAGSPDADPDQPIALRGFSWIVNPFESGGVVVAIEMQLGAAVAGPFDVPEADLSSKIQRVMEDARRGGAYPAGSRTVH